MAHRQLQNSHTRLAPTRLDETQAFLKKFAQGEWRNSLKTPELSKLPRLLPATTLSQI
jgi:hypothetical protein